MEVPLDQIYFPVGLALDVREGPVVPEDVTTHDKLVVVSSDFDLQYNGGAIQSYDLELLDAKLPTRCALDQECPAGVCDKGLCAAADGSRCSEAGERNADDRLLYPGLCKPLDPAPFQISKVKIGAFATDAILRARTDDEIKRLFVPVRGDSTLHWLDLDARGNLDCGQVGDGACDDRHRVGDDPSETERDITLGPEPFAIDASEHAESIVVTNQTTNTVTLFTTDAGSAPVPEQWTTPPRIEFALNTNLPQRPVGVAALPLTEQERRASEKRTPAYTFLLTFRDSAQVRLVRFASDLDSSGDRPYLVDGGGIGISANSVGSDSRGVAVDDSARKAAELACGGDDACLSQAALVPLDVYVANRSPASLLIGRTTPPQQYPSFFQALPLTTGPSRVVVGKVLTPDNVEETRVFVVCFESRRIFIYDPKRSRIEADIFTGRGPHALAVDSKRHLLYVGHFTDSYVGVYSLDLAFPETYGSMLGMLGSPKSPRSSK